MKIVGEGLSFDDVLIVPNKSDIVSRKEVDTTTKITNNIKLKIPVISANMETVTGVDMAVAMAHIGGLGILHRYCTIEDQARMVKQVKRKQSYIIENPLCISPEENLIVARKLMNEHFGSLLVIKNEELVGILTERDIMFEDDSALVSDVMTSELVTAEPGISIDDARNILHEYRIEKLPLINKEKQVHGLITMKDILKRESHPDATRDKKGRLVVGAAVGVVGDYLERTEALVDAEVDVIVVDIAHGHSELAINAVKQIKEKFPKIEIIAGNLATAEGAEALIEAGADCLKVGIGPGSICTTRLVAGAGVPQLSAIMEVVKIAEKYNVGVIADGGIKLPGDLSKAIGAGADAGMCGNLFAGTTESPGKVILKNGKRFKVYRGSTSYGSRMYKKEHADGKNGDEDIEGYVPEGVEGVVPYRGSVEDVVMHLVGGLRSGMSYTGASTIFEMKEKCKFVKITSGGLRESRSHDIAVN